MQYQVKQLTEGDVSLLKKLLCVFGNAFGDSATYTGAMPSDAYLEALLHKSHFLALVALSDGSVVGGLAAYELEKFEQERSEIYIYDLAVEKTHRRKGVAVQLINELRRTAGQRNAHVIFVQADRGDEPAIRLYESLGTREDVHHFDIDVL
jgi:aminoglycoside 3-N-acetyltransferase I